MSACPYIVTAKTTFGYEKLNQMVKKTSSLKRAGRYLNPYLGSSRLGGLGRRNNPAHAQREVVAGDRFRSAGMVINDGKPLSGRVKTGEIRVTWIGHSTFVIQIGNRTILTDPMFGKRASPLPGVGPKRFQRPGLRVVDLPPIDLLLVSHNHYDHLDAGTVEKIDRSTPVVVPEGLAHWFAARSFSAIHEAKWWEVSEVDGITITAVPAQHFSTRNGLTDRNSSLWCGWVIEYAGQKVYFAGDSGYSPFFKEIGEHWLGLDLALIPIGAYAPRWFMSPVHCDPYEAVQIHLDVRARQSIGMHWGTFRLTSEPVGEPPLLLNAAAKERHLAEDEFSTMSIGETRMIRGSDE